MVMHDTGAIGPAPCSLRAARVSGSGVTQRRISCEPPLPPLSTPNLMCVCVCVCPFNSLTWLTHTRFVNLMQPCKHALSLSLSLCVQVSDREPIFSSELGLAVEKLPDEYTLKDLWEVS